MTVLCIGEYKDEITRTCTPVLEYNGIIIWWYQVILVNSVYA